MNDRVTQVQAQITGLSAKHETDVSGLNERLTAADNKVQQAAVSAAQANANAAQANANAARADASAAQANAGVARAEAATAQAAANAAQERAVIAQNTPPRAPTSSAGTAYRSKLPAKLPKTGSPLPLIALSGLFSLGAAGALRLFRR